MIARVGTTAAQLSYCPTEQPFDRSYMKELIEHESQHEDVSWRTQQ